MRKKFFIYILSHVWHLPKQPEKGQEPRLKYVNKECKLNRNASLVINYIIRYVIALSSYGLIFWKHVLGRFLYHAFSATERKLCLPDARFAWLSFGISPPYQKHFPSSFRRGAGGGRVGGVWVSVLKAAAERQAADWFSWTMEQWSLSSISPSFLYKNKGKTDLLRVLWAFQCSFNYRLLLRFRPRRCFCVCLTRCVGVEGGVVQREREREILMVRFWACMTLKSLYSHVWYSFLILYTVIIFWCVQLQLLNEFIHVK